MGLNLDKIKKRQKETETKSRGGYWKPQDGKNYIRVFTFDHEVTKQDVAKGLFDKKQLGKTVTELDRPVLRFFPDGGKPVFASDEDVAAWQKKMDRTKPKSKEREQVRRSGPQQHWMLNIVDTSANEMRVVEFAANKTIYNAILQTVLDPEFGEEILGPEGRDFIITLDEKKEGAARFGIQLRDAKKSEKLSDDLQEEVKDYYDPDVYAALADEETSDDSDDEDDEEEEEEKPTSKKSRKDEEEDDEDDDADDEDDDEDDDDGGEEEDDDADDEDDLDDEDEEDDEEEEEAPKRGKGKGGKK